MLPVGKNRGGDLDRHEDNHFARWRAFGADDVESYTPYVKPNPQTLFLGWVTLSEQKWVILGECRGREL